MRFLRKPHVWYVPMLGWYACRMFGSAWGFGPTIRSAFNDWKKRNDLIIEDGGLDGDAPLPDDYVDGLVDDMMEATNAR